MPQESSQNYLKAWREHRGMTTGKLADAVGTSDAVIDLLEAGERRLSPKWRARIAPVLHTPPGSLLDVDPAQFSDDNLET